MVRWQGGCGMKESSRKKKTPKRVLRLPDLDYAKAAVLNTLGSPASKRVYEFAIDDFVTWYCSEPRLAFSKAVVVRYRLYLKSRGDDERSVFLFGARDGASDDLSGDGMNHPVHIHGYDFHGRGKGRRRQRKCDR
jgi:hypothetical protein